MDEKSFFGGILHVCYAPEYETVEDTRHKLQDRRRYVARTAQMKGSVCSLFSFLVVFLRRLDSYRPGVDLWLSVKPFVTLLVRRAIRIRFDVIAYSA